MPLAAVPVAVLVVVPVVARRADVRAVEDVLVLAFTPLPVATTVRSVGPVVPVACGAGVLFISTGENAALPATVGAPVDVVNALVAALLVGAAVVAAVLAVVVAPPPPVNVGIGDAAAIAPPDRVTSPPVIAGTGCELIEEFTVDCGRTAFAGDSNCPLDTATFCCVPPGSAGPRT